MPRRIEIELTSAREDGTWTWRAAGAREPKGTLDGSLLFDGASIGTVVRADADFDVEGIVITSVLPPKGARQEPERLELLGAPVRDEDLVTSKLVEKKRGGRDAGRGRRDRSDRDGEGRGERRDRGPRPPRADGDGASRERRPRPEKRAARPPVDAKPKPKRLRPGRTHRSAVLASLPEEERPIAEQVVRGGIPAVRQAVEKQNEQARSEGQPEIKAEPLLAIAERILPRVKEAEWHDRADAALATIDDLDLRDLRSVVVASDTGARDDESRELANQLRDGLNRRVEEEHSAWLAEIDATLVDGRVVRALRLSSRPPKAGAPLPPELSTRLAEAAGAALGPEITQDRWATVLDAISYSPVRQHVTPAAIPSEPSDELLAAVRKLASRTPEIAAKFGIAPVETSAAGRRKRGRGGKGGAVPPPPPREPAEAQASPPAPVVDEPSGPEPADAQASASAPPVEETVAPTDEAPTPEAPAPPETPLVAAEPEQPQAEAESQPEAETQSAPGPDSVAEPESAPEPESVAEPESVEDPESQPSS